MPFKTVHTFKANKLGSASPAVTSGKYRNAKSVQLQQLANEVCRINPSMAEILNNAAELISDTPWLF